MDQHSQTRLNRMAFVGYDLVTSVGSWTHVRVDRPDDSYRRADMEVSGMGAAPGSGPVRPMAPAGSTAPANAPSANPAQSAIVSPKDEVEISAAGKMLERLSETPEARAERLAQIKQAIQNGDYDTDAKLDAALERMFEVHGFDLGDE